MPEELPHPSVVQYTGLLKLINPLMDGLNSAQKEGNIESQAILETSIGRLDTRIEGLGATAVVQRHIVNASSTAGRTIDDLDMVRAENLLTEDELNKADHKAEQALLLAVSCAMRHGVELDGFTPVQTQNAERPQPVPVSGKPATPAGPEVPAAPEPAPETDSKYLPTRTADLLAAFMRMYSPILTAMGVNLSLEDWHRPLDESGELVTAQTEQLADERRAALKDLRLLLEVVHRGTFTLDDFELPAEDWRREFFTQCAQQLVDEAQWGLLTDLVDTPPSFTITADRSGTNRSSNVTLGSLTYDTSWLQRATAIGVRLAEPVTQTDLSSVMPTDRANLRIETFPDLPKPIDEALQSFLKACMDIDGGAEASIEAALPQILDAVLGKDMVKSTVRAARARGVIPDTPRTPLSLDECIHVVLWRSDRDAYARSREGLSRVLPLVRDNIQGQAR